MVHARIIDSTAPSELCLSIIRGRLNLACRLAESHKTRMKQILARYSNWIRRISYQRGYEAGLAAGKEQAATLLHKIEYAYDTTIESAHSDILRTAHELAQHIVDTSLMQHPEVLLQWTNHALAILKRAKTTTLRYHPRIEPALLQVTSNLPQHVRIIPDPSLSSSDLTIECESGAVEFSRLISALEEPPCV